jgi:type II secretory pathway component GspD/PulD (secretin)
MFQTGLDLSAGPDGVVRKPRYESVNIGTRIAATPTVSADRGTVRLKFRYESAQLGKAAAVVPVSVGDATETENPADLLARPSVIRQEIERELTIPAGKTAILLGPKFDREERIEYGTPVRSSIAQFSRLFHKVVSRPMSCRQLILVTPRVLTTEECPKAQAAKLVAAYRKACADGRTEEAMKCAMQALAKDPHCFAEQK